MPTMHAEAPGRRALIDAATRLAATGRCISSLGLRELAREAGLNPNTFYRHFADLDDLGLVMVEEFDEQLHAPLRAMRQTAAGASQAPAGPWGPGQAARSRHVCHETVRLFFEFALTNRDAMVVGLRELHGPSDKLREAVQGVMRRQARELSEDLRLLQLVPADLAPEVVQSLAEMVSRNLFYQALDLLADPQRYAALLGSAVDQIMFLYTGAAYLQATGALTSTVATPD